MRILLALAMTAAALSAQTLTHAQGHVRATLGDLAFEADEGSLKSGELELHGHVRTIFPARADRTLFRYGAGSLLTDKPVGFHADRVTIKNGMLEATGNVVILPTDENLPRNSHVQGDEMSMALKTADATVRGNIKSTDIPQPVTPSGFRRLDRAFPPEIIK